MLLRIIKILLKSNPIKSGQRADKVKHKDKTKVKLLFPSFFLSSGQWPT